MLARDVVEVAAVLGDHARRRGRRGVFIFSAMRGQLGLEGLRERAEVGDRRVDVGPVGLDQRLQGRRRCCGCSRRSRRAASAPRRRRGTAQRGGDLLEVAAHVVGGLRMMSSKRSGWRRRGRSPGQPRRARAARGRISTYLSPSIPRLVTSARGPLVQHDARVEGQRDQTASVAVEGSRSTMPTRTPAMRTGLFSSSPPPRGRPPGPAAGRPCAPIGISSILRMNTPRTTRATSMNRPILAAWLMHSSSSRGLAVRGTSGCTGRRGRGRPPARDRDDPARAQHRDPVGDPERRDFMSWVIVTIVTAKVLAHLDDDA